jgi:uncharacterized protein with PQ loop repeat
VIGRRLRKDPRWRETMLEEMAALDFFTWVLTSILVDKNIVGCKWVFTDKETLEGRLERYKAQDYPVAKMNTIRTLISVALNLQCKSILNGC